MDKAKIRFLVSILLDSDLYLRMPVYKRMSLLSKLAESYPFLFSLVEGDGDKEHDLTWSEILCPEDEDE